MALPKDLQRIEKAMEALARVGRSRKAATLRAARAGLPITGAAQTALRTILEDGPIRISDLARQLELGDAAVSRLVTGLEAGGLVTREADPADGRVAIAKATAAGLNLGKKLRRAADTIFSERLADWSAADLATLAGLVERLADDLRKPAKG